MLSFYSIGVHTHKKPSKFILTTLGGVPSEMYIYNDSGQFVRNPEASPIVSSVILQIKTFNSVRVDFDVFMAPSADTYCQINFYEYSEIDPYNPSLLKFNTNVIAQKESRLHILATNLNSNTTYRVKIRAVSNVNSQTLLSEWVEETVTTEELPSNFNGFMNNFYYINGTQTTLSPTGTGVWNNIYYYNGMLTSLESVECLGADSLIGYLFGKFTVDFAVYNGEFVCDCCTEVQKQMYNGYYIDGRRRPADWTGIGFTQSYAPVAPWLANAYGYSYANIPYSNVTTYYTASVPFTGYTNGKFYVDGVESPFDLNGVGSISVGGTTYNFVNGAPVSGNKNGKYYVGGVETSLSSDGTGTWNGKIYNKGSFVSLVNIAYTWQQGAINGNEYNYSSSFGSGITYG
jgi:hypothetical protein